MLQSDRIIGVMKLQVELLYIQMRSSVIRVIVLMLRYGLRILIQELMRESLMQGLIIIHLGLIIRHL